MIETIATAPSPVQNDRGAAAVPVAAPLPSATCPLCHTVDVTMTSHALATGGTWRCVRCGQRWTAERLATAAAYARYVSESGIAGAD